MRLLSLLSFYDEQEELLALHVDALAKAGVSHLVALDGRYGLLPSDNDVSPAAQRGVLDAACAHHGIGLTLSVPQGAWESEPEKRTALFDIALAASHPGDWWLNCDADMIITKAPDDLVAQLVDSQHETASALVVDVMAQRAKRADWNPEFAMRCLFRAQPVTVGPNHYTYRNALTGKPLWSGPDPRGIDAPLNLTASVTIEHRADMRTPSRRLMQSQYYARRDTSGAEMGKCPRCNERQAVARVTCGLRMIKGLPAGHIEELCEECGKREESVSRRKLRSWGMNPDEVRFNERYSLPVAK